MKHRSPTENIRKAWRRDYDAYLVYKPEFIDRRDLFYLAKFPGSTGFFLQTKGRNILVVDSRYHGVAKTHAPLGVEVVEVPHGESPVSVVVKLIRELEVKNIGIEDYVPVRFWKLLEERLPKSIRMHAVHGITINARRFKFAAEIAAIRKAQQVTDAIFRRLPKLIQAGKHTEYEVALIIEDEAKKLGAEGISFPPIVAAGKHAASPHHPPGNHRIPKRGALLLDFGVRYRGYCSDFTRTVWLGEKPSAEFAEAYRTVLAAYVAGVRACAFRKSEKAKNIDAVARGIIEKSRFKGLFTHGLGHGVGLEVHEGVSLSPSSMDVVQPGEVVTVEPGIYLPGKFGIRIEDMVIAGKGEMLSQVPRKLAVW